MKYNRKLPPKTFKKARQTLLSADTPVTESVPSVPVPKSPEQNTASLTDTLNTLSDLSMAFESPSKRKSKKEE